jgi:uncharacterized protein (TIGR02145 family)
MQFVNPSCSATANCANAGTFLKSASGWNSYNGIPAGTDDYGFSGLPGGYGYSNGYFDGGGNFGRWWSSTEYDVYIAYSQDMDYDYAGVGGYFNDKTNLYSVRCVQD